MKHHFFLKSAWVALLPMFVFLSSCQEKNDKVEATALTPDDSKVYLEETLTELQREVELSEWRNDAEILQGIARSMDKKADLNADVISQMASDLWEGWIDRGYNGYDRFLDCLFRFSEIRGHFLQDPSGKFFQEDGDFQDLVIKANVDGESVVASLSIRERDQKINVFHWLYDLYGFDPITGVYSKQYKNETTVDAFLPTAATFTFTKGEQVLASVDLNLEANVQGNVFNPNTDSFNLTSAVHFSQYVVEIKQVEYHSESASGSISVRRNNGKNLISVQAYGTADIPASASRLDPDHFNGTDARVMRTSIQVLDRLSFSGEIYDGMDTYDKIQNLYKNDQNELLYKQALKEMEKSFDFSMYYKNNTAVQATFGLEPKLFTYVYREYSPYPPYSSTVYTHLYWAASPVIRFPDGTSYSMGAYFSEDNFSGTVNKAEDLVQSVIDWFGNLDRFLGRN